MTSMPALSMLCTMACSRAGTPGGCRTAWADPRTHSPATQLELRRWSTCSLTPNHKRLDRPCAAPVTSAGQTAGPRSGYLAEGGATGVVEELAA